MPDWTYHPLSGPAAALLGERRSRHAALHALAVLTGLPGGRRLVTGVFGHPPVPGVGAVVPPHLAEDARRALPPLGASVVRVGPPEPHEVVLHDPSTAAATALLADRGTTVLASPALLLEAGPGWFQRVAEATTPTTAPPPVRDLPRNPLRWPAWCWGALVGLGMLVAGTGAAAITLGPVLLWYDRSFLGMTLDDLHAVNHNLVHFLQHDRVTMAGTMVAIGFLYTGLSAGGIRHGWPWARTALLVSGAIGFPTLFFFLSYGFLEPLHILATAVLVPMFVVATRRAPRSPRWTALPDGPEAVRRRALVGQLLMIVTGVGLFVGAVVVTATGLSAVFVPSDLGYLVTDADALSAVNPRLVPFVAHDRAGFGGALMAAAAAIALLALWGWRRGDSWVWWTLALAAAAGFVPALVVHGVIGYTDFWHLAPVYVGVVLTAVALVLSRPYLCARDEVSAKSTG
ncbi:hypothetical protein [Umezawaea tangerina]|uniref:Uncharacterized protein n=1 Tax=Umezawaea tangerina TaxID=84725 RepID=A0A2T0SDZ6_9PSEU|nr:hypothetical protein [Umezawaea tangerina]PRY31611.1 hypothetical protein CLV43_12217 [Umezawaea tangerina]